MTGMLTDARLGRLAVIALVFGLSSSSAVAQVSDTTPPQLQSFSFAPTSIDVTASTQAVTVTVTVTDDLAGVEPACCGVQVGFRSPSGGQTRSAVGFLVSGDSLSGTWEAVVDLPRFSEAGTWTAFVFLIDRVGNQVFLNAADLVALGFPSELAVSAVQDTNPPQLITLGFAPALIDTSANSQAVTVTVGVTDDLAGVASACCGVQVGFRGPSGVQTHSAVGFLMSGGSTSGTWEAIVNLPQFSEAGTWRVFVFMIDLVGNQVFLSADELQAAGFSTDLEVLSNPSDTAAPGLANLNFGPVLIDTSMSAQAVTAVLEVTDDLSGVTPTCCGVQVGFRSPSGGQIRSAVGFLTSGGPLSGTWEALVNFPQFSEAGTWRPFAFLFDRVGNQVFLDATDLQSQGFPTSLVVIRPSLVSDGTIVDPALGGTVSDDTFGPRAQVTFPPGVLGGPTDVAIDVFQDPLDVPIPQGFAGPGTRFVNIALTPEPVFPLPAPGLTLVLPLVNFDPPGTPLSLFRVDPATGFLVPALDISGQPVVGTVDSPDGLSATFTGIAQLSIVVGLVPSETIVEIDVKPGSFPNSIKLSSEGVVPVAILTTTSFDAATVDPSTVTLGGASVRVKGRSGKAGALEDVDADGDLDLVVHISTEQLVPTSGAVELLLRGTTFDGTTIQGSDVVRIIP